MRWCVALAGAMVTGCVLQVDAPPADPRDAAAPIPDAAAPMSDAAPVPDAVPPSDADCSKGARAEGRVLTALRAPPLTVFVDGTLDDRAWYYANRAVFSHPATSDNETAAHVLWDEHALLFAFEVTDAQLEAVDGEPHLDDGAELYVDVAHDQSTGLDADDVHVIATINQMWTGGDLVTRFAAVGTTGYVIEIAIPWETLGVTPEPGRVMGLLLGNNDRDADVPVQYDWLGLIDSGDYDRPNLWGDLVLSDQVAGAGCD